MFSKKEREQYFQKVLAHERAIGHKIQELFQAIQDSEYKGSLDKLFKDDTRNGSFAILLYGVLQGVVDEESKAYCFIRRFLESISPAAEHEEKRNFFR